MFGYAGKILDVNLSDGSARAVETPEKLARSFIGIRGLGAALLYKELKPGVDPLSPANVLILLTGPATGTPLPACARWGAVTKSPLTGTYLCSNVGGFFGAELKKAGFDGLIIKGRSENPTWLKVTEGGVEFKDAKDFWGKTVEETEMGIRQELKDRRVAITSIGQAGENLVKFATAQVDVRFGGRGGSLGRGGVGAVMGSKNLKAVTVRGHGKIEVADEGGFFEFQRELTTEMKTNQLMLNFTNYGTPQFIGPVNEAKMWPTRNFQQGSFEGVEKISAETMKKQLVRHNTACHACSVASGKYSTVDEGPYAGTVVDGPEYETIWGFGAQCGVDRLDAIAAANAWCDSYGVDTISAGNVIGFAMECYERGLLKKGDVGIDLRFGNHEALVPMIKKIAFREGVGDLLAEGVRKAAARIGRGAEKFAMHVKGMEMPAYDPRGAWGMALAYATSCRGACHLKAWTIGVEILNPQYDRFSADKKAKLVSDFQNVRAVVDSMGVCVFGTRAIGVGEMIKILSTVVGWNMNSAEMVKVGERIYNVERAIAVRDGISRKDDTLPQRILEEKLPGLEGPSLTKGDLDRMLDEYYRVRGWDKDGRPTKEKLKELSIPDLLEG
jgi:aldehyde:ferredoxin oxidoreductase